MGPVGGLVGVCLSCRIAHARLSPGKAHAAHLQSLLPIPVVDLEPLHGSPLNDEAIKVLRDSRHTFATWHREAETPTHELQRLGGWKTQSMVERYAHVAPEGLQLAPDRLNQFMVGLD